MKLTSKAKGRLGAAIVFIISLVLYGSMLYDGIYPGISAHNIAVAKGLESGASQVETFQINKTKTSPSPYNVQFAGRTKTYATVSYTELRTKHIIWRIMTAFTSHLPFGDSITNLNALSMIFGALAVMLAFALGRGLIIFLNFHESPVSSRKRNLSATVAGVIGAATLALSAPLWLASTRLHPDSFEIFAVLLMGWLLFSTAVSQKSAYIGLFGFIWGISIFEFTSPLLLPAVLMLFAVRSMIIGGVMNIRSCSHMLIGIAVGAILYIVLTNLLLINTDGSILLPVSEFIRQTIIPFNLVMSGNIFHRPPQLISLLAVIIPFVITVCHAIWHNEERKVAAGDLLIFLIALTTAITLTGSAISPWQIFKSSDAPYMPVWVPLFASATATYLAANGLLHADGSLFGSHRKYNIDGDEDIDSQIQTHVGRILFWSIFIFTAISAIVNYREIRDSRDTFIAKCANAVVANLDGHSWITSTTEELDTYIRIIANEKNTAVSIIERSTAPSSLRRLCNAVSTDEAFKGLPTENLINSLNSTNRNNFVTTWIEADPEISKKIILDSPVIADAVGKTPIPALIGYRIAKDGENIDWPDLADRHIDFWSELNKDNLPLGRAAPKELFKARLSARAYLADVGKTLAEQLVKNGATTKALDVFEMSNTIRQEPVQKTGNTILKLY